MYDSGAQWSLVCDLQLLTDIKDHTQTYLTATNSTGTATHTGNLVLQGQDITITLPDVMYGPQAEYNMISTWSLAEAGYDVTHNTDELWITSKSDRKRYVIARSPGDHLFWGTSDLLPLEQSEEPPAALYPALCENIGARQYAALLHIRTSEIPNPFGPRNLIYYHLVCGHASLEALKALRNLKIISFEDDRDDIQRIRECRVCNETNLVAKPHSKNHAPTTKKHERVHSDTIGPIIGERGRHFYITTLIDEHTRYIEIIITGTKSFKERLLNRLKVWNSRAQVRYFRSDNATEMPTEEELANLGIEKDPISSYSPEQNGFAEAMNRVLLAQVRKIVKPFEHYNYLPLLEHIYNHAAYMLNLLKPRNRGTSPQIAYHSQPVNHDNFMTFGVDVTVKLKHHQEARTAGAPFDKVHKTTQGIYLGHLGENTGYREAGYKVLVDYTNVLKTRDITFGNKMDNLVEYFEEIDRMNLERIHPDMDMFQQIKQAAQLKQHMSNFPIHVNGEREVNNLDEQIDAIETEPLTEAVEEAYRSGHAVVQTQPDIVTAIEVP
ncbi:hypothetical protein OY671_007358, partial [Metschnikowia pulcherrima]